MEFSLIHAGLAAGAALAVVPLIIHLIMRQPPKHVLFPALRLLKDRHKRSTKRLRIKNWLLLLARMALVALMALALARPSLKSSVSLGDREVPTALALIIDTSASMGYVDRGQTRLEEAKRVAESILRKLPETSQVFVIDSGLPVARTPVTPSAARKQLEGLEIRAANRPLNQALERAYEALAESPTDLPRLEVYVLTDLAQTAWEPGQEIRGRQQLEEEMGRSAATYVIRLSPDEVRNAAVLAAEARPAALAEPDGRRPYEIAATLVNVGPAETRLVEFYLDGTKRAARDVELPADGQVTTTFQTPPDPGSGIHHAEIRLSGGVDPLEADDHRYLTFEVEPAFNVLVVYDADPDADPRSIDATFIADALDPQAIGAPFRVETIATGQITDRFPRELLNYTCVFINNVQKLPESCWAQLAAYLRAGGGVVVALGQNVDREAYATDAARRVIPGAVGPTFEADPPTSFQLLDPSHPLFSLYTEALESTLAVVPIFKFAGFEPEDAPTVRTLLAYQDGSPALVEWVQDNANVGRVLLWTTPLSRRPTPGDPDAWNEFPVGDWAWAFLVLQQRTVSYLSGSSSTRLNYLAGQPAILPLDPASRAASYLVTGPSPELNDRINPDRDAQDLVIEGAVTPGLWRVRPDRDLSDSQQEALPELGFSVNIAPDESRFGAIEAEEIQTILGGDEENFALASSPDELERAKNFVRVGRELYPWLIALILALLTAENFLANRFHRRPSQAAADATPSPAQAA